MVRIKTLEDKSGAGAGESLAETNGAKNRVMWRGLPVSCFLRGEATHGREVTVRWE